ncbi:CaiB/BaiF CoA transferase family protein [Chloroflexota bacterium]
MTKQDKKTGKGVMPLEGIRIIDWTLWQLGAVATAMLGSWGAEVIKLEERTGDPSRGTRRIRGLPAALPGGRNVTHEMYSRNKKSVTVDLKKPEGKEIVYRLVEKSDVFVQNRRPGAARRIGLDYQTLSKYNKKLIYATGSGFGLKGPDANMLAMDFLGIARSGVMFTARGQDKPPEIFGVGTADQIGAIFLAYGIMTALVARERLGIGQEMDVSHLGSMIALEELGVTATLLTNLSFPEQIREKALNPLWNCYQCRDGKWIALGHFQPDPYWPRLCRALKLEHLINDPKFHDYEAKEQHNEELIRILDEVFRTRTRPEWLTILGKEDLIYCEVNTFNDLAQDPQVIANKYVEEFDHDVLGKIKLVGSPVKLSRTPAIPTRTRAPELGEHTEQVLLDIAGYSWEDISNLRDKEVI